MSIDNLELSIEKAEERWTGRIRKRRTDSGSTRLPLPVEKCLRALVSGQDKPATADVLGQLSGFCHRRDLPVPSRATLYNHLRRMEGHRYFMGVLPPAVRRALHNLDVDAKVPGHQVVFACFHQGDLSALSFAAGMPWLDLYQAARMRGWRPRTRGLFDAVLSARGI